MPIKFTNYLWIGSSLNDIHVSNGLQNWFYGNGGNDQIEGDSSADFIFGGSGFDALRGGGGDDSLFGGAGVDQLIGGEGADYLDGGTGSDFVFYKDSDAAVTVNLSTGQGSGGHAEGDVLSSIENVFGSDFGDTLTGTAAENSLYGGEGNDVLNGGGGDDVIVGGQNTGTANDLGDIMTGGLGADSFSFSQGSSGGGTSVDFITDFGNGADTLYFSAEQMLTPLTFSGEQTDFQTAGTEVWFRTYDNPALGTVTEVNVRIDQEGRYDLYYKVLLDGDVELDASDLDGFWV